MSRRTQKALSIATAGALAALTCAGAWSAPTVLMPGDTGIPVPLYNGPTNPAVTVLANTGIQSATIGGTTVQFDEVAVSTSLNPSGVSFAFAIATSNVPTELSAALPGYGGFSTSVESCDPLAPTSLNVCGMASGTAARSSGVGDLVTFSSMGTTPVTIPIIGTVNATNGYAIFTNASSFMDPSVSVSDDGMTFVFNGIAPAGSVLVPEPATLALLGLGLIGTALAQRRRRTITPA